MAVAAGLGQTGGPSGPRCNLAADGGGATSTAGRRRRVGAVVVGALLVVLVVAELAAGVVVARLTSAALEPCLPHDRVEVIAVGRPLVPRLLVGRLGDVELAGEGVEVRGLRLARVEATVPDARLPWALGAPAPTPMRFDVEVEQAALEEWVRARTPLGIPLTVALAPDGVTVGVERLPFEVSLDVAVADGVLTVRPAGGDRAWWRTLGIATELPLPDDVEVARVALDDARADVVLLVEVEPELSGDGLCTPWG